MSDDTTGAFEIEPTSGTLNKRGGDPTPIVVKYMGGGKGGFLVVQTEEEKWTYELKVP